MNIETTITYREGWDWNSSKSYILDAVDQYLMSLRKSWADSDNLTVRISQLESRILDCEGVIDIVGTTLNGSASNLLLATNEIPVRGNVNGN